MLTENHIRALNFLSVKHDNPLPTEGMIGWMRLGDESTTLNLLVVLGLVERDEDGRHEITEEGKMARDGILFAD